jgi:hypothetical protein
LFMTPIVFTNLDIFEGKLCLPNIKTEMGCVRSVIAIPFGTIYNHVSESHCITVLKVLTIIQIDREVPLIVRDSICFQFPSSPAPI